MKRLFATVLLLEAASGMPYGVVNDLVPVWLKTKGMSLAELGALTLVGLPWTLKVFWGPFIDRVGTFRTWMIVGLAGACVGTALLGTTLPVVPILIAIAIASAVQDVAIDGWLVAAVPPEQQGRATGIRVAGYRGAMALAGGGGVVLGARYGWDVAIAAVLALQGALLVHHWFLAAPPPHVEPTGAEWLTTLKTWLTQENAAALFAFALLFKLGDSAMAPMVKPFWLDSGLTPVEVGTLSTTVGAVLVGAGAVLGGELLSRVGLRRGALVLGASQALSNVGYAAAGVVGGRPAIYTASVGESLTAGFGSAALLAIFMRACGGAQAATRFALLTAIIGLTRTIAGAFSGLGVEGLGYPAYFGLTFLLAIPGLFLIGPVTRHLDAA